MEENIELEPVHGMLDTETLDTKPTAALVQLGLTLDNGNSFQRTINIEDAVKYGTVGGSTLAFWFSQSKETQACVVDQGGMIISNLYHALRDFNDFCAENKVTHLWAHATFDFPILQNALDQFKLNMPVGFRNLRDVRTIEHLYADQITWDKREGTHHEALADAQFQLKHLMRMLAVHESKIKESK